MNSRPPSAIRAEDLTKNYAGAVPVAAVSRVTLDIQPGELIALVGPSGAGKSTLLSLLGGLMTPTSGRIVVNGQDISTLGPTGRARARCAGIGFVFQFHHLLPELTALENVALPGMVLAGYDGGRPTAAQAADRARELLDAVGLGARREHRPTELSGGEAQRVALARALANRPAVILADEPTGNLDQATARDLMDLIESLNRGAGQTFVIATHNQELVDRASRVLRLVNGELTA
jgi:lipoprotein-releasing system ATP-binding protein